MTGEQGQDVLAVVSELSDLMVEITQERVRQITGEGYSLAHDDRHREGELAGAASALALAAAAQAGGMPLEQLGAAPPMWPEEWGQDAWKPKEQRRNLVRAAALILAELGRIDRQARKG